MKKTICNVLYDTDVDTLIQSKTSGSFGDPSGYEEKLFVTAGGNYYLYTNGGEASVYPKESIKRLSKKNADAYCSALK